MEHKDTVLEEEIVKDDAQEEVVENEETTEENQENVVDIEDKLEEKKLEMKWMLLMINIKDFKQNMQTIEEELNKKKKL